MAASRDDFIIAIRSAILKKGNKQRISLIVLIFFWWYFLPSPPLPHKERGGEGKGMRVYVNCGTLMCNARIRYNVNVLRSVVCHEKTLNFWQRFSSNAHNTHNV